MPPFLTGNFPPIRHRIARLLILFAAVILLALPRQVRGSNVEIYTIATAAGVPGSAGSTNGSPGNARFALPYGIAVDPAGVVYVADTYNHTIRKIANGQVSTLAGLAGTSGSANGTGNAARFNAPYAVAADAGGNVYVADTFNQTIRKITSAGVVSTLAGLAGTSGSSDGAGTTARFNNPNAIAVDSTGNIYVADTDNKTIRKITPDGTVVTLAGLAGTSGSADGTGSAARFSTFVGLAVDSTGNVYVADTVNCTIRKITPAGITSTLAGSVGSVGSADGTGAAARFNLPRGVAVDGDGNILVGDEFNQTLRKVTRAGVVTTIAGTAGISGSSDGQGSAARFNRLTAIAVDSSGILYAADTFNHTIRSGTRSVVTVPPPLVDGVLDQSFNPGEFTNGEVFSSALQRDGKLIIAGLFNKVHGVVRHGMARLNADGTLDTSFDPGTGPDVYTASLVLDAEDKPIIGNISAFNGLALPTGFVRLNTNGSVDTSFAPLRMISQDGKDDGTGTATAPGFVSQVILQPDGKPILLGYFSYVIAAPGHALPLSGIARFNPDGSLDTTFNPGSGVSLGSDNGYVYAGVRLESGKIVIWGGFDNYNGHPAAGFARLNSDGSYDSSFDAGSGLTNPNDYVAGLVNEVGDHLIVFGSFSSFDGTPVKGIVRLTESGAVDTAFAPGVFAEYNEAASINSVVEQADGKLLIGGWFHTLNDVVANGIVRLNTDGSRDFTLDGSHAVGPSGIRINSLTVRPSDGQIFVGGYFSTFDDQARNNMAWMAPDGSVDPTFAGLLGATDYNPQVYAVVPQPDGKVLVGGIFTSVDGTPHNNLVRLKQDGSVDSSFSSPSGTEGSLRAIRLQPDGKILIAGTLRAVDGVARGKIARLKSDGTLDPSFDPGIGADDTINAIALDGSGNIYVGGRFLNFSGSPRVRLAKLGTNGALDTMFDPGGGPSSTVLALAPSPDSNGLVIGGSFSKYNGVVTGTTIRVNATTGARDPSFNSGGSGATGSVSAIALRSDGKYYLGGSISNFNGVGTGNIVRLNSDGSRDTAFVKSLSAGSVLCIALQGSGLLAGATDFTNNSAVPLRLADTGLVDQNLNSGNGATVAPANAYYFPVPGLSDIALSAIAIQNDGKPILGGAFNSYDGWPRTALVRLTDPSLAFGAESNKTHGQAGSLQILLPPSGAPGIECRGAGTHQINLTFPGSVTLGGAAVTSGIGTVVGFSTSGNTATVNLTGVADAQTLGLTLSGISTGGSSADVTLRLSFLLGDTNGDGVVNSADATQTRNHSGSLSDLTNFRSDVNSDGGINSADATIVRAHSGTGLHTAVRSSTAEAQRKAQ